jgi:hypothetical protein
VVLYINLDKGVPHMVKDLMHIRLQLKGPNIEQFDSAAGPVHSYGIQLLPGFWQVSNAQSG